MLSREQHEMIRPRMFSIQVFALAMIIGVVIFAIVTYLMVDSERLGNPLKMLTLIATITAAAMFGLSVIAPGMFSSGVQSPGPDTDESAIDKSIKTAANAILVETLIRYCLIEAAILLNLMVFFIEPHYAHLAVALVGILLMLFFFPRRPSMTARIENQIR